MTYKRFEYVAFDGFTDNEEFITPHEVVKLLNELYEENELLKKEELIGESLELFKQNMLLKLNNDELREENKRLQRCINEIYTIARLEEV